MSNAKIIADKADIVAIANAVRSKINKSKEMTLSEITTEINNISVGEDNSFPYNLTVSDNMGWNYEHFYSKKEGILILITSGVLGTPRQHSITGGVIECIALGSNTLYICISEIEGDVTLNLTFKNPYA